MKFRSINLLTDIQTGDTLIVQGEDTLELYKNVTVKSTVQDGVEIILNKKKNTFLNLGMYLQGKSWVKQVLKIDK